MPNGEEKFTLDEMIENFDLSRISLGAPVFDVDKLSWLNGRWLRETLDDEQFADRVTEWALNRENLLRIIPLVKERVDVFSELAPMISFFAEGMPSISADDLKVKNIEEEDVKKILQFSLWRLEALTRWEHDPLNQLFVDLAGQLGLKIRDVLAPMFVAISGKPISPPLFDSMAILGPDICRARVRHALNVLGGVSKKQAKRLEKEYKEL